MPVFLIPMVVGGYYYLKSRKDKEGGGGDQQQTDDPRQRQRQQLTGEGALVEESPSIEVSLILDQKNLNVSESQIVEVLEPPPAVSSTSASSCTLSGISCSQSDPLYTTATSASDAPVNDDANNQYNNSSIDMDNSIRIEVTPCYSQDLLERKNSSDTVQTEMTSDTEGNINDSTGSIDCTMICDQDLFDFVECAREVGLVDDRIISKSSVGTTI